MLTLSRRKSARNKIESHNLEIAVAHAKKYFGLELQDESQAIAEYQHFMYLAYWKRRLFGTFSVVPTHLADKIWHGHLLDSADYRGFCERVVGEFIDHHPAGRRTREDHLYATGQTKMLHDEYGAEGFCPDYLGNVRVKRSDTRQTTSDDDGGLLIIHLASADSGGSDSDDSSSDGCGD